MIRLNYLPAIMLALLIAIVTLTIAPACSHASEATQRQPATGEEATASADGVPELRRTDFMTGLNNPWDLAFAGAETMLFTEKCRGLSVRLPDGSVNRLFGARGNAVVADDFTCQGQSGMQGVAVDPDFESNRRIYLFMTSNLSSPATNRIVRLRVNSGFTSVLDRTDIVDDIPFKHRRNNVGGAGAHSGGRLRFGPDGYLYIATGDNHNGPIPQDLSSLGGKVLRVDRDGKAALQNEVPDGADPRIYTYGHRNVQGISFHPETGQAYIAEHGPNHNDEVTPLVSGGNCGWDPTPAESGVACPDDYCGYTSNRRDGTLTPMTDLRRYPNALRSIWQNDGESDGMSPAVFLTGPQWKRWDGALAVGFLAGQRINILELDEDGARERITRANLSRSRIRSLVQGPDGNLYVATDSGSIWRVSPR